MTTIPKDQTERLFELCWHMEQSGNRGYSAGRHVGIGEYRMPESGRKFYGTAYWVCNPKQFDKALRDGILYYSSGHGWRVRKNPHWFSVFCQRFPHTVKAWRDGIRP